MKVWSLWILVFVPVVALVGCKTDKSTETEEEQPAIAAKMAEPAQPAAETADAAIPEQARKILDAAIAAHGGLDKLKATSERTGKSKGTYMGMAYESVNTYRPGEIRMDITVADGEDMSMVMGDRNCWMKTGPVVVPCSERERNNNREYMTYERTLHLWPLKTGEWQIAPGELNIEGKPHPSLTISKEGLRGEAIIAFDPDTQLIRRTIIPGRMGEIEGKYITNHLEYKQFCDIKLGSKLITHFGGKQMMDEAFSEINCGPVDANQFIQPTQVADGTTVERKTGSSKVACSTMKGDYSKTGGAIRELMGFLGQKKLQPMGAPLMIYVKAPPKVKKPENFLTEVCMPVGGKPPEAPQKEGDFVIKQLAPTKVLSMYGLGDYATKSGELAKKLMGELAKRKLKAAGALRQITYMDPTKVPADKQVSEMQIPIE